jgi:hypothetical protein
MAEKRSTAMSTDQIVVLSVIVAAFLLFAAVLAWGDHQTKNLNRTARPSGAKNNQPDPLGPETVHSRPTIVGARSREVA